MMYPQRKGKSLQRTKWITKIKCIYLSILFTTFFIFITSGPMLKYYLAFVINPRSVLNLTILFRWFGDTAFKIVGAGSVGIWVNRFFSSHDGHVMPIEGVILVGVSIFSCSWSGGELLTHFVGYISPKPQNPRYLKN